MRQIEELIFPLVESHFPDFYRDEGPRFVNFVKEYYRWMESEGEALYASRNLLDYRNIDTTSPEFIKYFTNKYLAGVPLSAEANTQFLIKHASDLYRSKGTERGVQLLIQGLFNEEAKVVFPGESIFKSSDGTWVKPQYLELTVSARTQGFVGKEIVGSRSGAKAFLESLVTRRIAGKYQQVAYLSNVRGIFETGELITPTSEPALDNAPVIIGSMTSLTVVDGGAEFAVGDIFDVSSSNGKQGKARVTEVSNETGKVTFIYIDALTSGGWGYSLAHANVIVSQKVLTLTNLSNANGLINTFSRFETVTQPLVNIAYTSAKGNNANFEPGNIVENYASNGTVIANGTIVVSNKTTNTQGYIVVVPNIGNIATQDTTFAIRHEDPDVSTFNASLIGYAYNTYTSTYTSAFTGVYTGQFTSEYTNAFTSTFTSGYGVTYTGTYGGSYTNQWSSVYASGMFTGSYSRVFSASYSATFTRVFTASGTSSFTGNYAGTFVVLPYSGQAYTSLFTGVYTSAGFTGVYTKTYTGAYNSIVFTTGFTGSTVPGPFVGVYTGAYAGSYIGYFTGARVSPFNGNSYVGNYGAYFSGVYVGNYQGTYPGVFVNPYSGQSFGAFTGAYSVVEYVSGSFTTAYSGSYNTLPVFTGSPNPYSGGTVSFVGSGFTGAYLGVYTSTYVNTFTSDYTKAFTSTYNLGTEYTSTFTAAYSSSFTGGYSNLYTSVFGETFTTTFNVTFSQQYTGVYSSEFTQPYTGLYNVFTGTYGSYSGLYTAGGNRINTTEPHQFSNNDLVRYHVLSNNTAVTDMSVGAAYYVVNTVQGSTYLYLASTPSGATLSFTKGSNETGHQLIKTLGTAVISSYSDRTATGNVIGSNVSYTSFSFNAQTAVSNTNDTITVSNHTFENNYVVRYVVSAGNTAIDGLINRNTYYVINTTASTFQLSLTRNGTPLNISSSNRSEQGHAFVHATGYLGVVDIGANGFVGSPYTVITGATSNTYAAVANVSTGTGADFRIGVLTDTENVLLSPDFIDGRNTGNVAFSTIKLNGIGSNVIAGGYGTNTAFNANTDVTAGTGGDGVLLPSSVQFDANTGVANTTDVITLQTKHVFSNNEQVTYAVHPTNTAISGLTDGSNYYVINTTPGSTSLQLSLTSGGAPINITAGASETGHSLTRAGTVGSNNTIAANIAIDLVPNSAVFYYTDAGNTAVGGLTTNTVYYVDQSNATHVSLKPSRTGSRVALTKGLTETGHRLYGPLKILTGANSTYGNVGSGEPMFRGLGFVKFPGASLDTILLDALRFDSTTIGSIASIAGLNPGSEYNVDPFVTVVDTYVVGYNRRDYVMEISNTSGAFVVGEQIQQTYNNVATQLTVSNFSGTSANGSSSSTFVLNEFVYQSNSTANVAASGFVLEAAISAGSGTLKVIGTSGTFVATTNTLTQLKGLSSGSTSNVSAIAATTYATTARALVKAANTTSLRLKRINLENTFLLGNTIIGRTSGTTANVVSIVEDANTLPVGLNAAIEANVQTANNVVKKLDVADSGFGFLDQETVTLTKPGSLFSVTAIVELGQQGVGAGYYSTTQGFISDDRKLQDNEYYQEYSYEVQTKVPFDLYFDVLKRVTHVAGTRAFGKVNTLSLANLTMTAINSIETSNT